MKKAIFIACIIFNSLFADKIGDLANILGVRDNQLIGYGLVVGLSGTGDKGGSKFTAQTMANLLESMNVKISSNDIKSSNVAAVMISASLPPFARQGDKIDIKISSIGDAKSLKGGTLIMTPLNAVDGQIYAIAQGSVAVGKDAQSGSILSGATVEKEVLYNIYNQDNATLSLKKANFQNAITIQNKLNNTFGKKIATAIDPRNIKVNKPENLTMIEFLSLVQEIDISYHSRDKILIDQQSGTIISGLDISVRPIVLTHGDLTLKITNGFDDDNDSQAIDEGSLNTKTNTLSTNGKTPTVANVVRALQKLGVSPQSMMAILESMKKSGAIAADIEIL